MGELILIILVVIFVYVLFSAKRSSANVARKKRDIVNKIRQRDR